MRTAFASVVLFLLACHSKPDEPTLRVCVFLTADLHGRVERLPSLAAFINAERARRKETVVHVDAGDVFQGTPEGDLTYGRVVIDAFNEMGVDALVPGNHDFDLGPKVAE